MNDRFDGRRLLADLFQDERGPGDAEILNRMLSYARKRQRLKIVRNTVSLVLLVMGAVLFYRGAAPVRETTRTKAVEIEIAQPSQNESLFVRSSTETVDLLRNEPNVHVINTLPLDRLVERLTDAELFTILGEQHAALFRRPGTPPTIVFIDQKEADRFIQ